jgi:hypothetical protein
MEQWVVNMSDLHELPETVDDFLSMKRDKGIHPSLTKPSDVSKAYVSFLKAAHGVETA